MRKGRSLPYWPIVTTAPVSSRNVRSGGIGVPSCGRNSFFGSTSVTVAFGRGRGITRASTMATPARAANNRRMAAFFISLSSRRRPARRRLAGQGDPEGRGRRLFPRRQLAGQLRHRLGNRFDPVSRVALLQLLLFLLQFLPGAR